MKSSFQQALPRALVLVAVIGLAAQATSVAGPPTEAGATFTRHGATYTARHVLHSSLQTADLLSICFDFKHLQGFYHESELRLLKIEPDSQTVEYRGDYKVCTSTAAYRKTLELPLHTVRFTLLYHQVSGWGMPVMTASTGSYVISDTDKLRTITYEQSVTLKHEIGALDWAMIQRKTTGFFTDFDSYIRKQETLLARPADSRKPATPP
jgi:hypothetical protein